MAAIIVADVAAMTAVSAAIIAGKRGSSGSGRNAAAGTSGNDVGSQQQLGRGRHRQRKQWQWRGHTTINQQMTVVTAAMAAAATAAHEI